ncbi:DPH4 [Candida theae]|uniref:Diphthamide biosynthesis protein 4 n=1 Tax=Candida theae TaxID=1198502 RepID=A0AAD5BC19_9ASCO|nr:DPH4 [Candida theae]KAI5949952.1 DPH4 [Candida theae]
MIQQPTYYEILNIPSTATQDQIKVAYKSKLLSNHPDKKNPSVIITTTTTTTTISATSDSRATSSNPDINSIITAYATLSSPRLRAQYDSDLQTKSKISGVNLTGDGLDSFTLDDFQCIEVEKEKSEDSVADDVNDGNSDLDAHEVQFVKMCPRCQCEQGMVLTEEDLITKGTKSEDDQDGGRFDIIVQCNSCSLWIHVKYYEEVE